MKQEVKIGQTDYTVLILVRDTAGAPKTGLVFNSAGIDVCYTRVETDNDVVLTAGAPVDLVTPALTDPHLDWGFLQVDATNAPGVYRLDLPDGVFAAGAWSAVVSLICTGCDPTHIEFMLVPEAPSAGVLATSLTGHTVQTADHTAAIAAVKAETVLIVEDTGELQTDDIPGKIAGLNNVSTAQVNAEVVDVLKTDTLTEPAQGAPGVNISMEAKIAWLYKLARNLITNDGTDIKVYNDAGAVVDHKAPVSETAGTVTRGEFVTGP